MTKIYPWNHFRKWGVDVQALCGEALTASKRYRVEPSGLPPDFQERLQRDGFDVRQPVTFEAVICADGFGIEVDQQHASNALS